MDGKLDPVIEALITYYQRKTKEPRPTAAPERRPPQSTSVMTLQTALLQGTQLLEEAASPFPGSPPKCCSPTPCAASANISTRIPSRNFARWSGSTMAAICTSAEGKPTQYITKRQEFYGREFRVTPDVLIPRPETEHVVEVALPCCAEGQGRARLLDVGTGSGALAVTLQLETGRPGCGHRYLTRGSRGGGGERRQPGRPSGFRSLRSVSALADGSMDLIVSNPPYVPLDQRSACSAKCATGSRTWRYSAARAVSSSTSASPPTRRACCVPAAGWSWSWASPATSRLGLLSGWREVRVEPDLAGIPRVAVAQWQR